MRYSLDRAVPHLLNGKPTNCGWCNNLLKGLRNIYKGQNCERYYCSHSCLTSGEDRAIRYRATLAGMVHSPWYVGLASILAVFMLVFATTPKARAEDHKHHSPWHDFYKDWQQPTPSKSSCCNARFNERGEEVGDCEATNLFELRRTKDGLRWFAFVPAIDQVIQVPDEKIIREKNPDQTGRMGHICFSPIVGVLCAVPPTGSL